MRPDSLSVSLWAGIYTKVNTFVQVVCYRESVLKIPNPKDAKLGLHYPVIWELPELCYKGIQLKSNFKCLRGDIPISFH